MGSFSPSGGRYPWNQTRANRVFAHEIGHFLFHDDAYEATNPFFPRDGWDLQFTPNIMFDAARRLHYENFLEIFGASPSGIQMGNWIENAVATEGRTFRSEGPCAKKQMIRTDNKNLSGQWAHTFSASAGRILQVSSTRRSRTTSCGE